MPDDFYNLANPHIMTISNLIGMGKLPLLYANGKIYMSSLNQSKMEHIQMLEIDEYKTLGLVMKELGIGEPKVRQEIAALGIVPTIFNADKRAKYYSQNDIERIRE